MLKQFVVLLAGLMLASGCSAEDAAAPAAAPTAATTVAAPATAVPATAWTAGTHYWVIEPPQPISSSEQVEVVEVFSYACPHCAHFQPYAARIKASLPEGVAFKYQPAVFSAAWAPFARAFFAARAMGVLDETHQALFDALHRDHKPLRSLEDLAGFYAGYGVDREQFMSTAQSFLVQNQMARAVDWVRATGVRATPTIVVDGKYRATAASAGGSEELIKLVDWLVARELVDGSDAS